MAVKTQPGPSRKLSEFNFGYKLLKA